VTLDGISDISPGDQVKKRKQVLTRTDRANRGEPAMRPHSPGATLNWLICGVNGTLGIVPAREGWLVRLEKVGWSGSGHRWPPACEAWHGSRHGTALGMAPP
jgi:hypothetical protein